MGVGGSWKLGFPATSQQLIRDSNQAEIFSCCSLQTLTRSQLQVGSAFLFLGITMSGILESLVTHLLQPVIYRLGELWDREAQGRAGKECRVARQPDTELSGHLEFLRNLNSAIYVRYRQVSFLCLEAGSFMAMCYLGEQ